MPRSEALMTTLSLLAEAAAPPVVNSFRRALPAPPAEPGAALGAGAGAGEPAAQGTERGRGEHNVSQNEPAIDRSAAR
jgi:hypothetical protein